MLRNYENFALPLTFIDRFYWCSNWWVLSSAQWGFPTCTFTNYNSTLGKGVFFSPFTGLLYYLHYHKCERLWSRSTLTTIYFVPWIFATLARRHRVLLRRVYLPLLSISVISEKGSGRPGGHRRGPALSSAATRTENRCCSETLLWKQTTLLGRSLCSCSAPSGDRKYLGEQIMTHWLLNMPRMNLAPTTTYAYP